MTELTGRATSVMDPHYGRDLAKAAERAGALGLALLLTWLSSDAVAVGVRAVRHEWHATGSIRSDQIGR